ncbi:MAG: efflux RND transporter periplasmic adaptor subunit [Thermodesulfobacteriota bacterium]
MRPRWLVLGAAVVASAVLVWWWTREEPVAVTLAAVERGRVERTVANTRAGTVEACQRAKIAPATGGQIERLEVREGDRVTAGQLLLELWNDDLSAQLELARREHVATQSRAEEACALADVAEREAQRLVRLRKQGVAAEETTERGVADATARRAACNAAHAAIGVSQARIDVARAALERTILHAPFAGVIAEVNGEVGEFVTPSPVGIPTLPTVDLIDTACVYVSAPIDEVDAAGVHPGLPARISLDAYPGRAFAGAVRRVAPYVLDVEKQARTVDVEVDFVDPADTRDLLIGYSADIEVVLSTRDDVLRVPTEAVLEGNRLLVFDDGVLDERRFEPGIANWQFTEVRSGASPDDRVVLSVAREGVRAGARAVPEEDAAPQSVARR